MGVSGLFLRCKRDFIAIWGPVVMVTCYSLTGGVAWRGGRDGNHWNAISESRRLLFLQNALAHTQQVLQRGPQTDVGHSRDLKEQGSSGLASSYKYLVMRCFFRPYLSHHLRDHGIRLSGLSGLHMLSSTDPKLLLLIIHLRLRCS